MDERMRRQQLVRELEMFAQDVAPSRLLAADALPPSPA
jgi:hypothetical protein